MVVFLFLRWVFVALLGSVVFLLEGGPGGSCVCVFYEKSPEVAGLLARVAVSSMTRAGKCTGTLACL